MNQLENSIPTKAVPLKSIWEIALLDEKKYEEIEDGDNTAKATGDRVNSQATGDMTVNVHESSENVVIFIGSKNCGKTSMILRVLERDEAPKPTIALEYTFGRRARGHNLVKDVGHLWELGGGTTMIDLLDIALNEETFTSSNIIAVVDLSKADELWETLEIIFASIKKRLKELTAQAGPGELMQLDSNISKLRSLDEHPERDMLTPINLPIVIVGSKYDKFQDIEPEQKKVICKTLRFVAHMYGASLLFYSSRNETLALRTKSLLSHLLFRTPVSKHLVTDYNKPLSIMAGMDSLQQIGSPPIKSGDIAPNEATTPMDLWKYAFASHFPQKSVHSHQQDIADPASDSQFNEPTVDSVRIQKNEELRRYRQKRAIEEKYGTE